MNCLFSQVLESLAPAAGAHNKRRKWRGKERKAPTHLIEISKHAHAARVTKNRQNHKVRSQEKLVNGDVCRS